MKIIISESMLEKIINLQEQSFFEKAYKKVVDFFTSSGNNCSKVEGNNWKELYNNLVKDGGVKKGEPLIIVWGPNQELYYTRDGKNLTLSGKVSTGAGGFSNTPGNKETSTGLMKIANKVVAKDYEVLVGKTPTGKILGPNKPSQRVDEKGVHHKAEVVSGILELSGLEDCNENVYSRNIYIHGTNSENSLGAPKSNGCVRVSTPFLRKLMNNVTKGTKVYIYT